LALFANEKWNFMCLTQWK